jgi:hypothetical protein
VTPTGPTSKELRRFAAEHVDALAAGAVLLGSGGGGDVAVAAQLLRQLLGSRSVEVVAAKSLPPDALVVHVGVVGAPDVLAERLIAPEDFAIAARAVVAQVGGELSAVGVIEIGGVNAMIPVLTAAQLGLPVVDGDLMGRAFPRISQTTLALAGHRAEPLAVVSPAFDTVIVPTCSAKAAESLVTSCVAAMGGAAALALYPTTATVLAAVGVPGSLSSCVKLGGTYLSALLGTVELADRLGGRRVFEGRVEELLPRDGPTPGSITLGDHGSGSTVRIDYLDEFLAVTMDGTTLACTPEVVVALDPRTRQPLRTDQIRLGQTLVLLTLPALHQWPDEARTVVGPPAFGLDLELVPR